ncbi:glycosyltransferase [Bifidobacterium sp. ESL0798]|nr:glycosyltransferase [Bifidobacterium sp. ESL0798]WEV73875.1 glycosyltransferase [Bifidobacterium sp. ESL0798]
MESISPKSRILFVDDGSHDKTWSIIADLHKSDESIFGGVKLAHNRGHQNALYAGLMVALRSGCDAAISMDADLQDDVDVVDDFISEYQDGNEIVYGVRSKRAKDTWFKRTSAEAFYKVFNWMGAETVYNHADYRLMGRASLQALSEYHEVNLFLRGIVPTLGFKTAKVYYERGEREAGESKYPLKKMISFAIQGITSFSTKPLSLCDRLWGGSYSGRYLHLRVCTRLDIRRQVRGRLGFVDVLDLAYRRFADGLPRYRRQLRGQDLLGVQASSAFLYRRTVLTKYVTEFVKPARQDSWTNPDWLVLQADQ